MRLLCMARYLVSVRSRDTALLAPDPAQGAFDPVMLSYLMFTRHQKRANSAVQVGGWVGEMRGLGWPQGVMPGPHAGPGGYA
jgi:hypothetical protein